MVKNLIELGKKFGTEEQCRAFLIQQRWDGVPECPYCGYNDKAYLIEGGKRFKCANKECYKKYSVTVGTVFEGSNIPLVTWFHALYLLTAHKRGISSIQLAKDLGVTQKTAWFLSHRIREALREKGSLLLGGEGKIVEADDTFIGGKIGNKNNAFRKEYKKHKNWQINKTVGVGMIERGGMVVMKFIDKYNEPKITSTIQDNLQPGAQIVTDEGNAYKFINNEDFSFQHTSINHNKKEYAREQYHTNSIEGVFSHFDRCVFGTYFHLSPKHMQRYFDEFTYRFNRRKQADGERFLNAISKISGRLSYKMLVNGEKTYKSPGKKSQKASK